MVSTEKLRPYLHLKDPNLSPGLHRGESLLLYCDHPCSWSSSTSGSATLSAQTCISDGHDIFRRGSTWDVAASRITWRLPVPKAGASLTRTKRRSTGDVDTPARNWADWPTASTVNFPPCIASAVSNRSSSPLRAAAPRATSSVLSEADGSLFATWERSTPSRSQLFFGHRLTTARVASLLTRIHTAPARYRPRPARFVDARDVGRGGAE